MKPGKDAENHTLVAIAIGSVIEPLLAGRPAEVQGAILADLTATWLAGHVADSPDQTEEFRRAMFDHWVETVWKLVPINERAAMEEREADHGTSQ